MEKEMETDVTQPSFNFPYQYNRLGKNRELFTDYGVTSFINVAANGEIQSQRSKANNAAKYSAVHPVLPLSSTAEEVKVPAKDRIMGHVIEANKKLKNFASKVQKNHSHGTRWGRTTHVEEISSAVMEFVEKASDTATLNCNLDSFEQCAGIQMPQWFKDLLNEYRDLEGLLIPQFNNYKYSGGCIDTISVDDTHCYIASAAGENFTNFRLTFVSKKAEGLLQSFNVAEIELPNTIYGVKSRKVQGQDFITVRTEEQCYMYRFTPDSPDEKLQTVTGPLNQHFQCADISPFIPGECLLIDENGQCSLWHGDRFDTVAARGTPRFQVYDNWRHVQYGSHPRQVLYADQTVVQIFDLRTSNAEGTDLLSLPCKLLHNRERIRACGRHPASIFYHLVATDYNLMIMDERYPKYPVLKWEHMLTSPPQYMSSICNSVDDNFIYLGSQYPADIHAFRFSANSGLPPIAVSRPHRAANIVDISVWPQFVDNCPNTDLLYRRLNTSLAGISTSQWQNGHVVFQMDSHGEIFHQVFSTTQSEADVTFSAGQKSHDLKPLPVAIERAHSWVKSWGEMMKQQLSDKIRTREVHPAQLGIYFYRNPHPSCPVCHPDLSNVPGGFEVANERDLCDTCMMFLYSGQNLVKSVQKDGVIASTSQDRPHNLQEVKDVPKDNALSQLLMKQWYGDKDSNTIDDIMKNWDNEVKEKRSAKKRTKDVDLPDMSEQSVLNRILASQKDSLNSLNAKPSASSELWDLSSISTTFDLDEGQRSRTGKHTPTRGQKDQIGSAKQSQSAKSLSKQVTKEMKRDKKRKRKDSNMSSDQFFREIESIILGSTGSEMSETFERVGGERVGTGLPMFTSLMAREQTTSHQSVSKQQTASVYSKQPTENIELVSLLSSPGSGTSRTSTIFKIPTSTRKKKSKKSKKNQSPSEASISVSELSEGVGSEDLFNDSSPDSIESGRASSVLSAASCMGMLGSQVTKKVSRQLFSSQTLDETAINRSVNSPRKDHIGASPRKESQKKHLAGF